MPPCAALKAVRAKVEDYFARCRLAAFDARAIAALNRQESEYLAIAAKDLKITADEVAGFPLARIEAGRALPLVEGVNPAWAGGARHPAKVAVVPLLGAGKTSLTEAEWAALNAKFAAYETWLGGKAGSVVEKLGLARVKEILAGPGRAALAAARGPGQGARAGVQGDQRRRPPRALQPRPAGAAPQFRQLRRFLFARQDGRSSRPARSISTVAAPNCASASTAPIRSRR